MVNLSRLTKGPAMTREEAEAFARHWIEAWNSRDVETVLSHFSDGVQFTSPRAALRVGAATVEGQDALRSYWNSSVEQIHSLHFALDHIVWDAERRELAIVYNAEINGQRSRACEFLRFSGDGRAEYGEAMYGAEV